MTAAWEAVIAILVIAVMTIAVLLMIVLRRIESVLSRVDGWLATPEVRPPGLQPGTRVHPFAAERQDGRPFSDEDLLGTRQMVIFMKADCLACRGLARELTRPALDTIALGDRVHIVVRDAHERDRLGLDPSVDIVFQHDGVLAWAFRSSATPQAFVINEDGVIAAAGFPAGVDNVRELFDQDFRRLAIAGG